jgi:hypothetical protein
MRGNSSGALVNCTTKMIDTLCFFLDPNHTVATGKACQQVSVGGKHKVSIIFVVQLTNATLTSFSGCMVRPKLVSAHWWTSETVHLAGDAWENLHCAILWSLHRLHKMSRRIHSDSQIGSKLKYPLKWILQLWAYLRIAMNPSTHFMETVKWS